MKFSKFREAEAEKLRSKVVDIVSRMPQGFAGNEVIREEKASRWDIGCLDDLTCLHCGEDLTRIPSPSGADNISYYTCNANSKHRFTRVAPQSFTQKLLGAATSMLTGAPPPITDEELAILDMQMDHKGD